MRSVVSASLCAVVSLVVAVAPITFVGEGIPPATKTALAGKDGNGGGGDRGGGRDRGASEGRSHSDKGFGSGRGARTANVGRNQGKGNPTGGPLGGHARPGLSLGLGRAAGVEDGAKGFDRDIGSVAAVLDDVATRAMIEQGWERAVPLDDGFINHGARVSAYVELAKALGYSAAVGALQANFGAPSTLDGEVAGLEQEIAELERALEGTDADTPEWRNIQERVAALEEELQATLDARAAVGRRGPPPGTWSSADLDVDDDGVVTRSDLDAALAGQNASAHR